MKHGEGGRQLKGKKDRKKKKITITYLHTLLDVCKYEGMRKCTCSTLIPCLLKDSKLNSFPDLTFDYTVLICNCMSFGL